MATTNFYLERPDKKGSKAITLIYLLNGRKMKYPTKFKTTDKDWDSKQQKVKRNGQDESVINFKLKEFKRIIEMEELNLKFQPEKLTFDYIKRKLDELTGNKRGALDFFDAFEEYIEEATTTKTLGTKKVYKITYNRLKEYSKLKRIQLTFDSMDSKFEIKYKDYLMNECKVLNNTIGKDFKTIKSFMNFAVERGYTENYKFKAFKVFKEDADIICLTEEELLKIYRFDKFQARLEIVRDAFCLGCFTGLRFSDLSQIKEENIKDDFIEMKSQKTRDSLRIPLNKYSKEILNKYNGKAPKMVTNQRMNNCLKEIGELAEIDEQILLTKYRGTQKLEVKEPKFKFITTHTARRTFVTLSLEKGMRPEVVMSITGHRDYKTFKKYIKLTENVKLAEMKNVWS